MNRRQCWNRDGYSFRMQILQRIERKLGKILINLISKFGSEESIRTLFIFTGRKLGIGLALPCHIEVSMIMQEVNKRALPRPAVVFDIGANIGEYSLAVLNLIPEVQVYSFEPNPNTFIFLKNKLEIYPAVRLFEFGLGSHNYTGYISESTENDPSSSIAEHESSPGAPVQVRHLMGVVSELKISRIDFMKIDAEGMDYEILLSAKLLIPTIQVIQFEISPKSITKCSLNMFFELLNSTHRIYIFTDKGLKYLAEYRYSDESYWGANYVAIIKEPIAL
jgi:FkbM family methyltransferase